MANLIGSTSSWLGIRRSARRVDGFFSRLLVACLSLVGSSALAGFVFGTLKKLS